MPDPQEELSRERDALTKRRAQSDQRRVAAGEAVKAAQAHIAIMEQELAAHKNEQRALELARCCTFVGWWMDGYWAMMMRTMTRRNAMQARHRVEGERERLGAQVASLRAEQATAHEALAARDAEIGERGSSDSSVNVVKTGDFVNTGDYVNTGDSLHRDAPGSGGAGRAATCTAAARV